MSHTYVISDIHGAFERFNRMLKKIKFNESDTLYVIGDAVNKGDNTFGVLDYIMNHPNIVMIKGNHELFLQLYLEGDEHIKRLYARFGGGSTLDELQHIQASQRQFYHDYLATLPLYKKINVNNEEYILTHSGYLAEPPAAEPIKYPDGSIDIISSIENWCTESEYDYLISADIHYIPGSVRLPKMIVGHYPTAQLECEGIYFGHNHGKNYIDIDNGVNVTKGRKLACLRLEDMLEFYV